MEKVRIVLSGMWVALMLTFLLGDMLRLFWGDITPGEIDGEVASQAMWLGAAVIMVIPIVMVVLSLTVGYRAIRWISIVVSALFVVLNLIGLPYVGGYDNFLIAVSVVFNAIIIRHAWTLAPSVAHQSTPQCGSSPPWPEFVHAQHHFGVAVSGFGCGVSDVIQLQDPVLLRFEVRVG